MQESASVDLNIIDLAVLHAMLWVTLKVSDLLMTWVWATWYKVKDWSLNSRCLQNSRCKCWCSYRPGYVCPTPDRMLPCPPGQFCPKASVSVMTCNYSTLLNQHPETIIPSQPNTVQREVYVDGRPISGNICMPRSTNPGSVSPNPWCYIVLVSNVLSLPA